MADRQLIDELRTIAKEEGISLGEVMRQGLEWRVRTRRRVPSFIGAVSFGEPGDDSSERVDELILEHLREQEERERDTRL